MKKVLSLIEGLNPLLVQILSVYYDPFICARIERDKGKHFNVYFAGEQIGILEITRGTSIQIATLPGLHGKGYGQLMLRGLLNKVTDIDHFGYSVDHRNYPSLKLLYKAGGGLEEPYRTGNCYFRGYLRRGGVVDPIHKQWLEEALLVAKECYSLFQPDKQKQQEALGYLKKFFEIQDFINNEIK